MTGAPAVFMSYVRFNDAHDDGLLSQFRERLAAEVRAQTGRDFAIFQDRNDIAWGQNWQQRIDEALDAVTLLLVIITPSLFRSPYCRAEFQRFLERERVLSRSDLILPVYYIGAREMDDPGLREADEMATVLASRQYVDWRELRFDQFTSPPVRRAIAQLASRMRDTFWSPPDTPSDGVSDAASEAALGVPQSQMVESLRSAEITRKTEPPTHVVDPYRRGDFVTVADAIAAAQPGDRVFVRPGLYTENLVVDKPLEILGDGPAREIVLQARDTDAVLFKANIGRIANLTLRQLGEGEWAAVDITQGRLDLDGCDISGQGLACVVIRGGADPRLRRNKIHDSKKAGVFVTDDGLGTLEDNDIFGTGWAGVIINGGANPTLRRNTIHDGMQGGVVVGDGRGRLEDNDIFGNDFSGLEIIDGGNPAVRHNTIRGGKQNGILVHKGGRGTVEDNDISGNAAAGVLVRNEGNPTLRRNKIHDNKKAGVLVTDDGLGTLEDNDIFAAGWAGVIINRGANPTLRRNTIHDGMQGGVVVGDGRGRLEDNDIFGNTFSGLEITDGGNPAVRHNTIRGGKQNGILVHKGGRGTIEDNDILGNATAGVLVRNEGNPTLRRNRIINNGMWGVWISDNGGGVFEDNDLTGNRQGSWKIAKDSEANVRRLGNRQRTRRTGPTASNE